MSAFYTFYAIVSGILDDDLEAEERDGLVVRSPMANMFLKSVLLRMVLSTFSKT